MIVEAIEGQWLFLRMNEIERRRATTPSWAFLPFLPRADRPMLSSPAQLEVELK